MDNKLVEKTTDINFGFRLIERKDMLSFGTDAILLSAFARTFGKGNAADFGAGSGIISLLCSYGNVFTHIDSVERADELIEPLERNIEINSLQDKISSVHCDIRDYNGRMLDCVVTNPPYLISGSGIENKDSLNNNARREHFGTIEDFVSCASKSLKPGGKFFCVYRPERICDLLYFMREYKIEPKIIVNVLHSSLKPPSLILVEGIKGAGKGTDITKPLVLFDESGSRTSDSVYIYENCAFPDDFFRK